ncbi:hemolysin family protein [Nocardiopsis exhalans]|uniref:CBS domain containing-hemolysin-like protein n=2 Tax=Nocardiopsis TaxID=2013 RepID=A0A840WK68_9ACTN|nr:MULTISPECIES: hemolysin family protein [Nocardiopsis]MBB5490488.1 CBS domain containing-hemolysin-like protein [Nocardiopsis metallicus]USY22997.1 hemolysin family protein [Nocardiopsis exhalans]
MISTILTILLGVVVVLLLIAANGYFVAQEFGYMAVDRSRLKARAAAGDTGARRALAVTNRTSFMLSGAQLGITVTGLLVGFVAEPMIGTSLGELLGGAGVPLGTGVAIGTITTLLLSTAVQMIFGELFPKNLAIAKPEPVARWLALSTNIYLKVFGPVIWVFDQAAIWLLKLVNITPVEDVQHAATPRDLERIIAESRETGDLPAEVSTLLDRTLDFHDRTAGHAMIPRPEVTTVEEGDPVSRVVELMASDHSRFPVLGEGVDDIVGVICLRDVLALGDRDLSGIRVSEVARPTVMVPTSLPLPGVLDQLREAGEEFACVVDEYGGLAGVITTEDLAEELVGEIADEHTPEEKAPAHLDGEDGYLVPGALHIDEVERLIGHDLPEGDYETIGGLVIHELHRLPLVGDRVDLPLPRPSSAHDGDPDTALTLTVNAVQRHVPSTVELRLIKVTDEQVKEREVWA